MGGAGAGARTGLRGRSGPGRGREGLGGARHSPGVKRPPPRRSEDPCRRALSCARAGQARGVPPARPRAAPAALWPCRGLPARPRSLAPTTNRPRGSTGACGPAGSRGAAGRSRPAALLCLSLPASAPAPASGQPLGRPRWAQGAGRWAELRSRCPAEQRLLGFTQCGMGSGLHPPAWGRGRWGEGKRGISVEGATQPAGRFWGRLPPMARMLWVGSSGQAGAGRAEQGEWVISWAAVAEGQKKMITGV